MSTDSCWTCRLPAVTMGPPCGWWAWTRAKPAGGGTWLDERHGSPGQRTEAIKPLYPNALTQSYQGIAYWDWSA